MKKYAFIIVLATLFTVSSIAQYDRYFELSGYATLNNSYAIGAPLQTWMGDDIKSGSPAFYNIGGTSFIGTGPFSKLWIGTSFSVTIPPSHSIWGSDLWFGGRKELVLNPYTMSVGLPFRFAPGGKDFSVSAEPALLITMLTGKFSTTGFVNVNDQQLTGTFNAGLGSIGMGFGLNFGAQYHFGILGLGIKAGLRMQKAALSFSDNSGGSWSPVDQGDKTIKLDLGGSYMTIGIMLRFRKNQDT